MEKEKLQSWLEFAKWFVGSGAIVWSTFIIDAGFKDREINVKEMEHYLQYMTYITNDKQVGELRSIAEFYKTISISEPVRKRWELYYGIVDDKYKLVQLQQKQVTDSITLLAQKISTNPASSVQLGERLSVLKAANEFLNVQLATDKQLPNSTEDLNAKAATVFEQKGISALAGGDLGTASKYFEKSEKAYPSFHNSYEINRLLKNAAPTYNQADDRSKQFILDTLSSRILEKHAWQMPQTSKDQLKQIKTKQNNDL